jgi:hypothetical protein
MGMAPDGVDADGLRQEVLSKMEASLHLPRQIQFSHLVDSRSH